MTLANAKTLKKTKLRNAEYYDLQSEFDQLYVDSVKGKMFKNLMDLISSEENIKLAYRNIKKNQGSKTPGTDEKTISDLEKWEINDLVKHVQRKFQWYQPQTVKRVEIPKGNGQMRPLGIPTIMDRLIQQCILQVMEPICEAKFHERSNGFRPNRSAENAISQAYKCAWQQKLHYVIDIDIKGFFENVSHGKLLKQMWSLGIRDKKLIKIISVMLKAEVAGIGFPERGTPQGGIISPLLSNIVLNELDWWIASQWEEFPTAYNYKCYIHSNGSANRSKKFRALRSTKLKECFIVRYADDFKIFCRNRQDAEKMFHATKQWLKDRLGLEVNEEKSKIVNLRKHYSEFLGIKFKVKKTKRGDKIEYIITSHMSDKTKDKVTQNLINMIKQIQRPKNEKETNTLIDRYNSNIIGIHNYYNMATMISKDCRDIAFRINRILENRLRIRIKKTSELKPTRYIEEHYGKSKQLRFIDGRALVPIGYVQYKNPVCKKREVNKYTPEGRMAIHKNLRDIDMEILHYLMRNPVGNQSIEYNDNRLSLYCAQKGKCAITGTHLEKKRIHCHHKVPKKLGGDDSYSNLIIIDVLVHRLIHATKIETIKKYLSELKLTDKQIKKVNSLRKYLGLDSI